MNLLVLLSVLACSTQAPEPATATAEPPEPTTSEAAPEQAVPSDSIYQLRAKLETHTGDNVELDIHRGHPTLVSMFYANCPMACPMLIEDIRSLEAKLEPEQRSGLRVLLVSLDPERDTPELMSEVVERHEIDATRWTLSRTDEATVREISAVLGIRYRMLDDGEMNHSSIVTLIDGDGRVLEQLEGLRQDPEPILKHLAVR